MKPLALWLKACCVRSMSALHWLLCRGRPFLPHGKVAPASNKDALPSLPLCNQYGGWLTVVAYNQVCMCSLLILHQLLDQTRFWRQIPNPTASQTKSPTRSYLYLRWCNIRSIPGATFCLLSSSLSDFLLQFYFLHQDSRFHLRAKNQNNIALHQFWADYHGNEGPSHALTVQIRALPSLCPTLKPLCPLFWTLFSSISLRVPKLMEESWFLA